MMRADFCTEFSTTAVTSQCAAQYCHLFGVIAWCVAGLLYCRLVLLGKDVRKLSGTTP